MLSYIYIWKYKSLLMPEKNVQCIIGLCKLGLEYTDYSVLRPAPTKKNGSPVYDTKLYPVVRFQFWILLHCQYSQVCSGFVMVVPVKVPSIGQINHLKIICIG